jgi:signal transduction histidine kinase
MPGQARRWPALSAPTARLRLTALYGGLFLAFGALLLLLTYLLVRRDLYLPFRRLLGSTATGRQITAVVVPKVTGALDQQVMIQGPIALLIVTLAAVALGWIVAGRILRPLSTITATARRISASNLTERLNLRGPEDELQALGDTLDGLFARLEASFEAQRHFVANASHELRTPLTRERTLLQVALDDPDTTAEVGRGTARAVLASNAEQEGLIEALLTLASGEGGLQAQAPVDLSSLTQGLLTRARGESGALGLSVVADIAPATTLGDARLIERLVSNLIDNALRHNIAGGRVDVATAMEDGRALLSVANSGPVIPAADVERLFQPFQRLRARRAPSGHGLGLSIVRAIAGAHGATLRACALPSGGLSVSVTFPGRADGVESPVAGDPVGTR